MGGGGGGGEEMGGGRGKNIKRKKRTLTWVSGLDGAYL